MLTAVAELMLVANLLYTSPVEDKILLAGNFGEPRLNHFHCGIDIKTGGVEGKRIFAIADGYVSRITVGLDGFGNALYVTHPDGNTSVYCHLKSFTPRIMALLRHWQYSRESYIADVRLKPYECPVARGQFIAISGNTGASQAPHLHLELYDTRSGHLLDPLNVLGQHVNDRLAPIAHAFMAYPVNGEGVFDGGTGKRSYGFSGHQMARHFTAWGKVGFGIWANDYMEDTYNKCGIKEIYLFVDGKEVFCSNINELSPVLNRRINYWGDYEHYIRYGVWYMKSFRCQGNTLPFIKTDENNGIIDFNIEKDYHIEYVLKDYFGNTSKYDFTVSGRKILLPQNRAVKNAATTYGSNLLTYSQPGVWLVIHRGILDGQLNISPRRISSTNPFSPLFSFYENSYPLASWAELSLAVRCKVDDPDKLYIFSTDGRNHGGVYHNGWVTSNIRELGISYGLAYDGKPPVVKSFLHEKWESKNIIKFDITDFESGIKSVKGYIDGQFVLFERRDKTNIYECKLMETPIKKNGKLRDLSLVATDNRNNIITFNDRIIY